MKAAGKRAFQEERTESKVLEGLEKTHVCTLSGTGRRLVWSVSGSKEGEGPIVKHAATHCHRASGCLTPG